MAPDRTPPDTSTLRRELIARRKAISPAWRAQAAERICARLEPLLSGAGVTRVGGYLAGKGELSLQPLIEAVPAAHWFMPRVLDASSMMFHRLPAESSRLITNRYGLCEPPPDALSIDIDKLDWLLMPLVGFDANGARLGMGGGYYDRALDGMAERGVPRRIGVAFDEQRVDALVQRPWDIACHAVVTPSGWYHSGLPETRLPTEDAPWPVG